MSNGNSIQPSEVELSFINEQKGEGSLSLFVVSAAGKEYLGWDVNPEDIEALYFEGIGVPRWESLQAENVEQQTAMYWERFNERMAGYPMIGRVRDTDVKVSFEAEELSALIDECERVAGSTSNDKALRAAQKFSLAAARAQSAGAALGLSPSQIPGL